MFAIKKFKEKRFCLDVNIPPAALEIHSNTALRHREEDKALSKVKKQQEPPKKGTNTSWNISNLWIS